jgi:CBS domain-containing protein
VYDRAIQTGRLFGKGLVIGTGRPVLKPIVAGLPLRPARRRHAMMVAAILKHKGHEVVSVRPAASISDVAHLLSERRIGAVIVRVGDGPLLGVVSERDIIHALAGHGAHALDMTAEQIMTRTLRTATPSTTMTEAMEIMTEGRFRHLPVLEDGQLIGIVSIGDVVKTRIMEQEYEVDSLKAYVAGTA